MKTDSELKKDVLAELEWDPEINAASIGVAAAISAVAAPMPKPISSTSGAARPNAACTSKACSPNGNT